jgi:hypothetical protein
MSSVSGTHVISSIISSTAFAKRAWMCQQLRAAHHRHPRSPGMVEKAIEERDHSMMFYLRFVVCRPLCASHRWPTIARMVNLPS